MMTIEILKEEFSVCKIPDISQVDLSDEFYFLAKTDEELSLVCHHTSVPSNAFTCENGWRAFRIGGVLDFSLIGILSKIASLLSENQISIFAISTYNTDYILVKNKDFNQAITILKNNQYEIKTL